MTGEGKGWAIVWTPLFWSRSGGGGGGIPPLSICRRVEDSAVASFELRASIAKRSEVPPHPRPNPRRTTPTARTLTSSNKEGGTTPLWFGSFGTSRQFGIEGIPVVPRGNVGRRPRYAICLLRAEGALQHRSRAPKGGERLNPREERREAPLAPARPYELSSTSRCFTFTITSSRSAKSLRIRSATVTDRCLPPVHPIAIVKCDFPSVTYAGTKNSNNGNSRP